MKGLSLIAMALMLMMSISACTGKGGTLDLRKPVSLNLEPPQGPNEYRQGWQDGCESGMNAYSSQFYKSLKVFKLKQDPLLRNNKMYYQVWKDAFLYCANFLYTSRRLKI